jgi:hypothetical protein
MALQPIVWPWQLLQFLIHIHSLYDFLDWRSARRKATTYTKNNTDIHASSGIRTYDLSSVCAVQDSSCLGMRGHCVKNTTTTTTSAATVTTTTTTTTTTSTTTTTTNNNNLWRIMKLFAVISSSYSTFFNTVTNLEEHQAIQFRRTDILRNQNYNLSRCMIKLSLSDNKREA